MTAALLAEVDPVGMVKRGLKSREGISLAEHVTDRPYAASWCWGPNGWICACETLLDAVRSSRGVLPIARSVNLS